MKTKLTLNHLPTHHPPQTFRRVLGIAEGQNLVCRQHIGQQTKSQSFNPLDETLPSAQKSLEPFFPRTLVLSPISVMDALVRPKVFFRP